MQPVYLDNNATTRVDPRVVDAMLPFFTEQFGNPSSSHSFGSDVGSALKAARQQLQALLGAPFDHEIVYTSGGTESDNAAILSALQTQDGRDEVIVSAVEHPAILNLVGHLEKTGQIKLHIIGVDSLGRLDMAAYRAALGPKTAIVSIMWANNETGTLFPVEALAQHAHGAGALFHTDAVQAVGKVPMNLAESAIDMLSLSGHKLHGPKGIGALFVRKGVKFRPLIRGGNQERGRRGGTENAPAIIGLGKAAELALAHLDDESTRVAQLRGRLESGLIQRIGHCHVIGDIENRLPNTANIGFDFAEGEAVLTHMNREGIAASLGSACSSGSMELSHVLRAMNVPYTVAQGAIRFSLSRENGEADIDRVLEVVPPIIDRLRAMSPQWAERAAGAPAFNQSYA
jgi:cysteine desulfurase